MKRYLIDNNPNKNNFEASLREAAKKIQEGGGKGPAIKEKRKLC